ncbi:MAG: response regulator [Verrucomicrobiota bacterium]
MAHTILIVDDSATTRALIRRIIKMADIPAENIHEAGDGKTALEMLDCVKVDLVLADLNMPEMNGFEMTRRMAANPAWRDIPVVVISAEPNAADFVQSHPGIRGFLKKPFSPEGFKTLVEKTLGVCHA